MPHVTTRKIHREDTEKTKKVFKAYHYKKIKIQKKAAKKSETKELQDRSRDNSEVGGSGAHFPLCTGGTPS